VKVMEGTKVVGFLGLGTMGAPMATNVLKAGFSVVVWNRTESKAQPLLDKGAVWADSPRQVGEKSDVVITMLADARAVRDVLFGPEGVSASNHRGLRVLEMSTISPAESVAIAQELSRRGMVMLDCPVSGSAKAAADASLTTIVGGDPTVVESVTPVLRAMAKNVFHMGPNGMGCYMKLVNNVVLAAVLAGFSEAFVLGKKAGLPPQKMLEVILQGSARCPLLEFKGKAIVEGNFAPTFALRLMRKDLSLALATANEVNAPMPLTSFLNEIHQAAIAAGLGDRDFSAIVQVFESLARAG
jgi:3-hydroxyisobutyrate dehydrogenase